MGGAPSICQKKAGGKPPPYTFVLWSYPQESTLIQKIFKKTKKNFLKKMLCKYPSHPLRTILSTELTSSR